LNQANKLQVEHMRLKQSKIVHKDKTEQADRHKQADVTQANAMKGLDLATARRERQDQILEAQREHDTQLMHDQREAETQRAHDLFAEEQRAKNARRTQLEQILHNAAMNAPQGEPEQ
jgi:hypothetical protein